MPTINVTPMITAAAVLVSPMPIIRTESNPMPVGIRGIAMMKGRMNATNAIQMTRSMLPFTSQYDDPMLAGRSMLRFETAIVVAA